MTTPGLIASTEFFNYEIASSYTEYSDGKTKTKTDLRNADKIKIGRAFTNGGDGKYTTDYFDANDKHIGKSVSEWLGSYVNTKYFIGETLVGASKTFWLGGEHLTNYFDLEHNVVNRSHAKKEGSATTTTYNLSIAEERPMLTKYNQVPTEFTVSPLLDEARKKSQFSSSSSTMHRAQPSTSQQEAKLAIKPKKEEGKCCSIM